MLAARRAACLRHLGCSISSRPSGNAQRAWQFRCASTAPGSGLSAEDRCAILDLCHRFDAALNKGHTDALAAFFTGDATLTTPKGTVQGVPDLLAYFKSVEPLARGNRHLTLNAVVQPEGPGRARVAAYRLLHRAVNPPVLLASGVIEDEVVLHQPGGEWRFASRRFVMDAPAQP